ncbi:DMT family transporter [Hylemonella sp. W303a]|uniref:DMT family transporter n=1 Tax=Hylemonella sp. W303a TaxID=3389873 RepID=UPI00396B335C
MISSRQLAALVLLTLMWGVNWPMMKFSLRELSPLYFRALTMSCGALFLYAWYRARGLRLWPRWDARAGEWRAIVVIGAPNILGWHALSILGVKELASGRAAVLGFTMPIWTVLLGALFFGERLTRRTVLAVIAVAAAVALLTSSEIGALSGRPQGIAWMMLAALCWAIGTLLLRRAQLTLPLEALTIWSMILSSVCLWVIAFASEPWPNWRFSAAMWLALAYGALINYGFAQTLWAGLARHLPPATSAMSVMAIPLVGTLSAALLIGETPHWQDWAAIVCVTAAIAAVLLPPGLLRPKRRLETP